MATHSAFQVSVPSSCLTSRHESHTRMYQTGTEIWYESVKTYPLSCVGTKLTSKTEK